MTEPRIFDAAEITAAADELYDAIRDVGPPQLVMPALGYAVAQVLMALDALPTATESARDIFVRQVDRHLKLMAIEAGKDN